VAIGSECKFMLFEPHCKAATSLPVCPTYALLQSGHINLFTPERAYLLGGWRCGISNFWMVLVVRRAVFRSLFLNRLVMNVVSLPMYVKGTHLYVVVFVSLTNVLVGRLWVGGLCVWAGKPLLDRILRMVSSSSSLYSFSFRW
jgi:hypothetical protein